MMTPKSSSTRIRYFFKTRIGLSVFVEYGFVWLGRIREGREETVCWLPPFLSTKLHSEHKLICFPLIWSLQQIGAAGAAFHKPLSDYMNSFVKESFPNTPKDQLKILDAGAGTGPIGIELDKLGYTCVHALDISEEMLNVARQKGVPYKRFICTALTEKRVCEVETGEFDIVIAAGALIMANVRPEALVEIVRMVKKGELVFPSLRES